MRDLCYNIVGCDSNMKLRAVRPGATLGFIGPAGAGFIPGRLESAVETARQMGYRVLLGDSCFASYGYLSGADRLRAADINAMFAHDDVDAIVCVRGGYGTPRILDMLDYDLARKHPKLLMGYSDITGLQLAYHKQCALPTLHCPMPTTEWALPAFDPYSKKSLIDGMTAMYEGYVIQNPPGCPTHPIHPGVARGILMGGNLSLVTALMGTRYAPDFAGKIILLEDVDEAPYRLDRMLTQLRLSGAFSACSGIVLGTFTNCLAKHPERSLTTAEVFSDLLPDGKPVLWGFQFGHSLPSLSIPLGIMAELDAENGTLTLLDSLYA